MDFKDYKILHTAFNRMLNCSKHTYSKPMLKNKHFMNKSVDFVSQMSIETNLVKLIVSDCGTQSCTLIKLEMSRDAIRLCIR